MGFKRACLLALSGRVKNKTRILAAVNVLGCCYFYLMMAVTVCLGVWEVVPGQYESSPVLSLFNNIAIAFLFLNVFGNYINAYRTDSTVRILKGKPPRLDTATSFHNGPSTEAIDIAGGEDAAITSLHATKMFLCRKCDVEVPERCHHCSLCQCCILRRDHHCFFLASCVGRHNQRYFIVFCLYMFLAGMYGTVMLAKHLQSHYRVEFNHVFSVVTLMPFTLWAWLTKSPVSDLSPGAVSAHQMFLTAVLNGCLGGGLAAGGFFLWQILLVVSGQTTFESGRNITRFSKAKRWDNYVDVFGEHWFIIWLLPVKYGKQLSNI